MSISAAPTRYVRSAIASPAGLAPASERDGAVAARTARQTSPLLRQAKARRVRNLGLAIVEYLGEREDAFPRIVAILELGRVSCERAPIRLRWQDRQERPGFDAKLHHWRLMR